MNTPALVITIIDPERFTDPLAFPNPKIVGQVGERTLQFRVRIFNPSRDPVNTVPLWTARLIGRGSEWTATWAAVELVEPNSVSVTGLSLSIALDVDSKLLDDGTYELEVRNGDAITSITVRVNQTDLHLVSAWPSLEAVARVEISKLEAEEGELEQVIEVADAKRQKVVSKIAALRLAIENR